MIPPSEPASAGPELGPERNEPAAAPPRDPASRRSTSCGCGRARPAAPKPAPRCSIWPPASRRRPPPSRCWPPPTDALDAHILGYTEAPGIPALRRAIAGHYRDRYGLDVDPDRCSSPPVRPVGSCWRSSPPSTPAAGSGWPGRAIRPTGTSCRRWAARWSTCRAARRPGSSRRSTMIAAAGSGRAGRRLAGEPDRHHARRRRSRRARRHMCRATASGWSPTRSTTGSPTAAEPPTSAWATDRSGFVVNSFSKYFSMTGWRIGWLLVPDDLIDAVDALAGNLAICPPAPAQYAALARLRRLRRVRRARRPVRRQPAAAADRTGRTRHRPAGARGRRVLHLRRRLAPDRRLAGVLRPVARRHRRRGRAGHRLRPGGRPPLPPDVVRRQYGDRRRCVGRPGPVLT